MYSQGLQIDVFQTQLIAVPASSVGATKLNDGGRVMLPATVLETISTLNMVYPLQFKITAYRRSPVYAAVLEFDAEMGTIVLPDWMFNQLQLRGNTPVRIETCTLGQGHIIKLQPHTKAFVALNDPRSVLEQHLTSYPVLFKGASIVIKWAGRDFVIDVADILDQKGNSMEAIITARADVQATELKVEFERPLDMPPSPTNDSPAPAAASPTGSNVIGGDGSVLFTPFAYKPPSLTSPDGPALAPPEAESNSPQPVYTPFQGSGQRLNGKAAPPPAPTTAQQAEMREKRLKAFEGKGHSLR